MIFCAAIFKVCLSNIFFLILESVACTYSRSMELALDLQRPATELSLYEPDDVCHENKSLFDVQHGLEQELNASRDFEKLLEKAVHSAPGVESEFGSNIDEEEPIEEEDSLINSVKLEAQESQKFEQFLLQSLGES